MKFMRRESGWVSQLGPGYMKPVLLNPPWLLDSPGELLFLNNYPNIPQHRWDWEPRVRLLKTSERSKALQRKASRKHHQSLHCRGKGWLQHCVAFIPRLRRWKKVTCPQCSLLGPQAQITQPNEDALIPLSLCFSTPRTSKFWNHPSLGLHSYPLLFSCSVVSNSLQPQGTAARQASLSFTITLSTQDNSSSGWGVPATRGHCGANHPSREMVTPLYRQASSKRRWESPLADLVTWWRWIQILRWHSVSMATMSLTPALLFHSPEGASRNTHNLHVFILRGGDCEGQRYGDSASHLLVIQHGQSFHPSQDEILGDFSPESLHADKKHPRGPQPKRQTLLTGWERTVEVHRITEEQNKTKTGK